MNLKLILLAAFLLLIPAAYAQPVKWYTIQQALELNKTAPKKIMIDVYTDWCGWCKRMDATTFSHPVIAQLLNDNFYPVKFDAESRDTILFAGHKLVNEGAASRNTHQFAIALLQGQLSYPSVVFLNEKNELIAPVPGYQTPAKFEPLLTFVASNLFLNQKYDEFQKNFKSAIVE